MALEAANAAVHRYFADDLSDIMDCMDVGFHTGVARSLLMTIAAQECVTNGQKAGVDGLHKTISGLDSRLDKQKFIEANNNPFMLPKKFEFTPHRGDQVCARGSGNWEGKWMEAGWEGMGLGRGAVASRSISEFINISLFAILFLGKRRPAIIPDRRIT